MKTKKKTIIVFALILLVLTYIFTKNEPIEYTLKESLTLAFTKAREYSPSIELYFMTSADETNTDTDSKVGIKGKRSKWNLVFAIPNTKKHILITVNKGKITNCQEVVGPNRPECLIKLDDIIMDSPTLVKKAEQAFRLLPSTGWAKGYHFVLSKENNILYVSILGDSPNGEWTAINYNMATGEVM